MFASTKWSRAHLLALPVAVVALLVAGCSGSAAPRVASLGSTTATTTATAPSGGVAPSGLLASVDKYAACMRAHGVPDFPDPVVHQSAGGDAVKVFVAPPAGAGQTAQYNAAANACKNLAPPRPTPPTITPQQQQDYLNAAACMRSHGITGFPDPVFSKGGVNFPLPSGMDANAPQFLQARQTCQQLIPAGLPYSD